MRLRRLGLSVVVHARRAIAHRITRLETVRSLDVLQHAFPELAFGDRQGISSHDGGISLWKGGEEDIPPGYMIDRSVFEVALMRLALDSGVQFTEEPPHNGIPTIVATGRHGGQKRRRIVPWRQVALSCELVPAKRMPSVWLEPLDCGWLWALRGENTLTATLFVDPASVKTSPSDTYYQCLEKSQFGRMVHLSPRNGIVSFEVTPSVAQSSSPLVLGDAALARDPLCAQGLNSAVSDGLAGAIIASALTKDELTPELAQKFLDGRQRRSTARHLRELGAAYASSGRTESYWMARALSAEKTAPPHSAWHPETVLGLSSRWRFGTAPILNEARVVEHEVLLSDDDESEPVAWLAGSPARAFLNPSAPPQTARALVSGWVKRGLLEPAQAPPLVHWLTSREILVPAH